MLLRIDRADATCYGFVQLIASSMERMIDGL